MGRLATQTGSRSAFDAPYPSPVSTATATVKCVTSHPVVRDIPGSNQTHGRARTHAPTQTHGGFSALKIDVRVALQQRKGVFILLTRSNSRSFLFVLSTTAMLSRNTTSHSFQGAFMLSIYCARHTEQTQTAASASRT